MTKDVKSTTRESDQADLEKLREILLGNEKQQIKQVLQDNARQVVGDVVIEALHDRQRQDGGLNSVLVPIVEKSVEKSVNDHSDQFVGYLYPLVGRLVRKSVTAFLAEFLEKTNELIENSLTFKGIAWRFKAWQAGVSFSQYVASRTFVFRVEQVLLIHADTGILLNSVSRNESDSKNADLVSSMLTAINDFVADSFNVQNDNSEQNLEVVKTEDFSLVIKRGPQLVLVAAVTGNIPQDISTQFQVSLEYIHKLFAKEIAEFCGDTIPFESTEQQLQECLVAELHPDAEKKKKTPFLAIFVVLLVLCGVGYFAWLSYEQNSLFDKVSELNNEPGIVINEIETLGISEISVQLLRDPLAINVEQWITENGLNPALVHIEETQFLSLEADIVKSRLQKIADRYSGVSLQWMDETPQLSGTLPNNLRQQLYRDVQAIPGIDNVDNLTRNVTSKEIELADEKSPEILEALFEINAARIDSTQIEFAQGQSALSDDAKIQLDQLANTLKNSIELSKSLELNVGLIIMGASDSSGSPQFNQSLSRKRAQMAQQYLIERGIEPGYLNAVGLGVVELKTTGEGARKVIFNLIDFEAK
ncbi:OmpA family protein [Aliiglaciecola sp. M165]|uniref:OmpA family protein n=1 Tax=Aliiglaciecola sp. M165 TaxID=2593649 RepID=UPI00118169E4|nr:OmpA family protein [Aliiglaciecola sp. M165]TRY33800.1 OmpA family protein [Aliiglaciecola sp. M165]